MRPFLVFDVEIKKTITQVAKELGLSDERKAFAFPHKLGFSVGVIYNSITQEYLVFQSAREFADYLLRFNGLIVSFNGKRFDLAVLLDEISIDDYNLLQLLPHLDILQDFYRKVDGKFRVSLDNVAQNTLNKAKTGNGANAPIMFQQGKMDELVEYCKNDVAITKELFEFGWTKGYIYYWDSIKGAQDEMSIDWSEQFATEDDY